MVKNAGKFLMPVIVSTGNHFKIDLVRYSLMKLVGLTSFDILMREGMHICKHINKTLLCQTHKTSQVAVIFKMNIHTSTPSAGQIVEKG